MKRKELEGVNDDDHFSISSSPIEIRRLDAEFSPAVQESNIFPQPQEEGHVGLDVINELADNNEERAIFLFNPVNYSRSSTWSVGQVHQFGAVAISAASDFDKYAIKVYLIFIRENAAAIYQILLANQSNTLKTSEDKAERQEKNFDRCFAVVPWVPSRLPPTQVAEVQQADVSEMMDAEGMELTSIDIEDYDIGIEQRVGTRFGGTSVNEGLYHWQQEQCILPHVL